MKLHTTTQTSAHWRMRILLARVNQTVRAKTKSQRGRNWLESKLTKVIPVGLYCKHHPVWHHRNLHPFPTPGNRPLNEAWVLLQPFLLPSTVKSHRPAPKTRISSWSKHTCNIVQLTGLCKHFQAYLLNEEKTIITNWKDPICMRFVPGNPTFTLRATKSFFARPAAPMLRYWSRLSLSSKFHISL